MKMGSKMAARYKQSMGDVNEEAITDPGCGRRFRCFARDLVLNVSNASVMKSVVLHTLSSRHQSGDQSTRYQVCPG